MAEAGFIRQFAGAVQVSAGPAAVGTAASAIAGAAAPALAPGSSGSFSFGTRYSVTFASRQPASSPPATAKASSAGRWRSAVMNRALSPFCAKTSTQSVRV